MATCASEDKWTWTLQRTANRYLQDYFKMHPYWPNRSVSTLWKGFDPELFCSWSNGMIIMEAAEQQNMMRLAGLQCIAIRPVSPWRHDGRARQCMTSIWYLVEISAVADINSQGIVELITNWNILVILWWAVWPHVAAYLLVFRLKPYKKNSSVSSDTI